MIPSRIALAMGLMATLLVAAVAQGETVRRTTNNNNNYNNNNNNRNFTTNLPAVDRSGSTRARQEMSVAQGELQKAEGAFSKVFADAKREFDGSSEYQEALKALKEAQLEYSNARAPVIEALKTKATYKAAVAERTAAEAKVESFKSNPGSSYDDIAAAATLAMNTSSVVSKMEAEALKADPKVTEASAKLKAANDRVTELRKKFEDSVKSGPNFASAKQAMDAARDKLKTAQAALADATAKEAAAERDRQAKIREERRRWEEQQRQQYNNNNNYNNNNRNRRW